VVALAAGCALAGLVATPLQLLSIALLVSAIDTISVIAGPTRTAVEDGPDAFERVALQLPPWDPRVLIGPVDAVFLAFFVTGAARVGLRPGASALAVTGGLVIAVGAALGTGAGLPAIPFMAAGLLIVNLDRVTPGVSVVKRR
jgi:hypothetical protein